VPPPHRQLVTAIVAAHDAAKHIESAIASLTAQTLDDLELVVVDDGSTDGTAAVVERLARADARIRLVRLDRNRGQAAALNVGMEIARGRYLAILDADDEAMPGRLAEQVAAFERDPALVLVGGAIVTWDEGQADKGQVWRYAADDAEIRVRTLFKSEVISGAITMDREQVVRHQLRFDETLRLGADWAMSIAAMRVGRVGNVEPVVMRYRIHPGQMTTGMMDDLGSDSTRIRRDVLAWAGLQPTDAEMRTHLAISPCNYWPFGSHPYFRARRDEILDLAGRWLERMTAAVIRTGRIPLEPLRAYTDEILSMTARALETSAAPTSLLSPSPSGPGSSPSRR
jgi:glycosyltransferase involved in cell wall biosynthesis